MASVWAMNSSLGNVRKHLLGVYEDSVTTGGALVGDAVLVELGAQILYLLDARFEIVELGTLVQTYCQSVHVATRHAAVGNEALVHNAEHLAAAPQLLVAECDEAAHVDNGVLLRRHGHDVGIREHLAYDLLDRLIGVALFARLDEVCVLGEAGRVDLQTHAVAVAQLRYLADVGHRYGLSAGRVVRDGQHDCRYALLGRLLQHLLQLGRVEVALEGNLQLRVGSLVDRTVDRVRLRNSRYDPWSCRSASCRAVRRPR